MSPALRAFCKVFFVAGLMLATAGPHATAQSDNPIVRQNAPAGAKNPFSWLFGGREERRVSAPARRTYQPARKVTSAPRPVTHPTVAAPAAPVVPGSSAPPADPSPPLVADAPVAAPQPAVNPVQIAIIGDSLGILLGQGLQDIYMDRPHVTINRRGRDSSGLVRDDFFDWPKALREVLVAPGKVDAVLVMIGSNDRQPLRDDQGVHEPRSERWREIYGERIDQVIAIAKDRKVPLIWVGLPVMRSERYSGDMLAFNDIYRDRAQRAGIPYVDIWEAFATEQGDYSVTGPDVGGDIVRLRTSDGVHFTKAGARKLAYFADRQVAPIVAAIQPRSDVAALPAPESAILPVLPRPGDPLALQPPPEPLPQLPNALRTTDHLLGIAAPEMPLRPALQPRPVAGPVATLTARPLTAGARLLEAPAARDSEAAKAFAEGRIAPAKPGRADDFRF